MKEELIRSCIITPIEEYVAHYSPYSWWKSPEELEDITGLNRLELVDLMHSHSEFVENHQGCYTTRNLYRKHTPFFEKLRHTFQGLID
jgi:hypothetical protein